MKIAIDNLQDQDSFVEVDSSTGESIVGGDSIEASFDIFSSSNNAQAGGSGSIFASGNNLRANFTSDIKTGKGFSRGFISAFSASG